MKTRKVKLSSGKRARYIAELKATDYYGKLSLRRVNGILFREDDIDEKSMKFVEKKPEVVLQFPSVESVDSMITRLFKLRLLMKAKKEEHVNNSSVQEISPEKAIQEIRLNARASKGRLPKELQSMMNKFTQMEKTMRELHMLLDEGVEKPKKESKAEPAIH